MSEFDQFLEEQMENPVFRKEWERLRSEMEETKAIITAARNATKITTS